MTGNGKQRQVVMLAYTLYSIDARIIREAETLVAHGYKVKLIAPIEDGKARNYVSGGVDVAGLKTTKYQGKSNARYLASYLWFTIIASFKLSWLFMRKKLDIIQKVFF